MQNEKENSASGSNPSESASDNDKGKVIPPEENKFGVIARDAVGVVAFGVLASIFFSTDHKIAGLWLSLITLLSVLHAPAHFLAKAKPGKRRKVWFGYFALVLAGIAWIGVWTYGLLHPVNANPQPQSVSRELRLAREIDDSIRRVFLLLRFSETNEFESICPVRGNLTVYRGVRAVPLGLSFTFNDGDCGSFSNGIKRREACYVVRLAIDGEHVKTQTVASDKTRIAAIFVPIPMWSVKEKPFKTIRDFHGSSLVVGVSRNLTNRLTSIEFIVNGWAVFHADAKGAAWVPGEDCALSKEKYDPTRPRNVAFTLALHGETLPFYPELSGGVSMWETADLWFSK
jgi:hypothetical protein